MNVVGGDSINVTTRNAAPQRLSVLRRAKRRVDLADFGNRAVRVMGQVMKTGFDTDIRSGFSLAQCGIESLTGGSVNGMHRGVCDAREISCA